MGTIPKEKKSIGKNYLKTFMKNNNSNEINNKGISLSK